MPEDRKRDEIDAAIADAAASFRDIADRLEAAPRQHAAEFLRRGEDAIEDLTREVESLLPPAEGGSRPRRITDPRILRGLAAVAVVVAAGLAARHWRRQQPPLHDVNGDGQVVVLCFGDSITAGNGVGVYPDQLQSDLGPLVKVVKEGRYGEKTKVGKERLRFALNTYHPDYVVVLEGINDDCSMRVETVFNLSLMASAIRGAGAVPLIGNVYVPSPSSEQDRACYDLLNRQLEATIKKTPGAAAVDFAAAMAGKNAELTVDGIHPNAPGAQLLAAVARAALVEASKGTGVTRSSPAGEETPAPSS